MSCRLGHFPRTVESADAAAAVAEEAAEPTSDVTEDAAPGAASARDAAARRATMRGENMARTVTSARRVRRGYIFEEYG